MSHNNYRGCYVEVSELTWPLRKDVKPCHGVMVLIGKDSGCDRSRVNSAIDVSIKEGKCRSTCQDVERLFAREAKDFDQWQALMCQST